MSRTNLLFSFALAASLGVAQAQMGQQPGTTGRTGTTGYPGTGGYPGTAGQPGGPIGQPGTMGPMGQPGTMGPMGQPCTTAGQPDPSASADPMGRPARMGQPCPAGQTGTTRQTNSGNEGSHVDDSALQQSVQHQLAGDVAFSDVKAAARDGRVELTGSVPSKADRGRAKDVAKAVPGVTSVKEHLSVGGDNGAGAGSHGSSSNGSSTQGQNTAGTMTSNGGTVPGNSGTPAPDPGAMNTRPDTAAPPPQSTPPTVPPNNTTNPPQAISYDSGVRLVYASFQAGASAPAMQSQSAAPNGQPKGRAAQEDGAHPSSNMTANPATGTAAASDNSTLQSQIESAIRNEPTLANSHVTVNVSDDGVQLSGTVPSGKDKVTAERLARSYVADRKLTDNLTVTGHGHSDMAPEHPAMNNSGTGNAVNPNTGTTGTTGENSSSPHQH